MSASRPQLTVSRSLPALALGVLSLAALSGCNSVESAPEQVRPAIVERPLTGDGRHLAYFSGEVRARHESQLGFRVAGKILHRQVDVGDRVVPGQVLAELDPADLRLDLDAGQAALASAQADLELAQSEFARAEALLDRQLISASQFDGQRTALAAAQARLEQAQSQLAVRRNQLGYTQLRADRAGVITAVQMESGQVVAPGQTVAVLAQDGELEVEIALPEAQVRDYRPGTSALIALWSDDERQHAGRIREIAPDADPASRTYRARVAFDENDDRVQLGRTARVRFEQTDAPNRLRIPLAALHALDQEPAVWIVDPQAHTVALKPVEVAAYREDAIELAGGLNADDWLVVAGVHTLHPGQRIRPIDRDNRPVLR